MICVRSVCDHIPSLAFKVKIAEGMKYLFQRFFLAKGTFRRLADGSTWKAAFSGCHDIREHFVQYRVANRDASYGDR